MPDTLAVGDTTAAPQAKATAPSTTQPHWLPMPSAIQNMALPLDFRNVSLGMNRNENTSSFNTIYEQARRQMFPKPTDLDRAFTVLGAAAMAAQWSMVFKQAIWNKNFHHHVEINAGGATPAGGTRAPYTPPAGQGIPPVKKR
jgi:hypothetical protein